MHCLICNLVNANTSTQIILLLDSWHNDRVKIVCGSKQKGQPSSVLSQSENIYIN